ncbi:MAG: serine/threonine protein kinase [Deltaproteobacteria bacterium]|nr:serine/threonine protein kinase [Deltaproteobacteria bacterium]
MNAARLGRYRLVERRGVGGMGEVWHAIVDGPRGFEQHVIVKRIRREYADEPEFIARLAAEARVCARLDHPGIVKVHEFAEVDGEHYLAMEMVDGWSLTEVLEAGPPPVALACHVAAEVADALAYAHDFQDERGRPLGLVHRDVSPGNVMLTRQGAVKLVDFGVHTIRDRHLDERTQTGRLLGTVAYMSPEQADGRAVDARSDQFSLGVVLHEAVTGQRLFRAGSDLETLRRVREAQVPRPSTIRPEVDRELDRVLLRMLARVPAERFRSCGEVAVALRIAARRAGVDSAAVRAYLGGLALASRGDAGGLPSRAATQALVPEVRTRWPWLVSAVITGLVALPYTLRASSCAAPPPVAPAPITGVDAGVAQSRPAAERSPPSPQPRRPPPGRPRRALAGPRPRCS